MYVSQVTTRAAPLNGLPPQSPIRSVPVTASSHHAPVTHTTVSRCTSAGQMESAGYPSQAIVQMTRRGSFGSKHGPTSPSLAPSASFPIKREDSINLIGTSPTASPPRSPRFSLPSRDMQDAHQQDTSHLTALVERSRQLAQPVFPAPGPPQEDASREQMPKLGLGLAIETQDARVLGSALEGTDLLGTRLSASASADHRRRPDPVVTEVERCALQAADVTQASGRNGRCKSSAITGTMIDESFVEVRGHGRSRSILIHSELDKFTSQGGPASPVPRPGGRSHNRSISVSLAGESFSSGRSYSACIREGSPQRGGPVMAIARQYVNLCFGLRVSREQAVELEPGWLARHMPIASVKEVCMAAIQVLSEQPTLVEVAAPCKVFGDIHGQFSDLLLFFHLFGQPQHHTGEVEAIEYVFLGDFVDRGKQSVEVILLLLCLKVLYSDRIWLIRGNHEDSDVNTRYGFREECLEKGHPGSEGSMLFSLIVDSFSWMPLAALIEDRILCVHGGIGGADGETLSLDQIAEIQRPFRSVFEDNFPYVTDQQWKIIMNLLWGDPTSDCGEGSHASCRTGKSGIPFIDQRQGFIRTFGPSLVKDFVETNQLDVVIRAHECVDKGFLFFAGGRLITLFSARNYAGMYENDAAMLLITRQRSPDGNGFKLRISPKVLKAAGASEPKPVYPQARDVSPCRNFDDYRTEWGLSVESRDHPASPVQQLHTGQYSAPAPTSPSRQVVPRSSIDSFAEAKRAQRNSVTPGSKDSTGDLHRGSPAVPCRSAAPHGSAVIASPVSASYVRVESPLQRRVGSQSITQVHRR